MANEYRVGVIGSTGRGNYGHGLDTVWREFPKTKVVAVVDDNRDGLAKAVKRLGNPKGYADYRQMLEKEKLDFVSICPRWLDQHRDMMVTAAESGVRGIYQEKPLCQTLRQADEMIAACDKNNVKVAVAHQTRYSPVLSHIEQLLGDGKIGRVLEYQMHGKEDRRGGGEDLWVLGTHIFDLTQHLAGTPLWVQGYARQDGELVTQKHVKPGAEGIGLLAGDSVGGTYALPNEAFAHFRSVKNGAGQPNRFGLTIFGSAGVIKMTFGYLPTAALLPDGSWAPGRTGKKWIPITSNGLGQAETLKDGGLHAGNVLAVRDLIDAVEEDRDPEASIHDALTAMEMIVGLFESHRQGGARVPFPLAKRDNPLAGL
ncbi:MAG: Gfo/Idh/MocA family protein [Limisphaerales bacterium]